MPNAVSPRSSIRRFAAGSFAVLLARLRFPILVGGLLALLAAWPLLRNTFDKLTAKPPVGGSISGDTEYWCPMCPGVISEWPSKCPVCSMALVRRQKGDMTPLPDGVVARVQLSPYRIQLAGLRTAPVEYRRLDCEVNVGGSLDSALTLAADVFEPEASALAVGQSGEGSADGFPEERIAARILEIAPAPTPQSGKRVRIQILAPRTPLRAGLYASVKFRTPVAALESSRWVESDRWAEETALNLAVGSDPFVSLADAAVRRAAASRGQTLCVPESAVIDTGVRRVVYVESMPGQFDAVEVRLGRRSGDSYPVRSGLEANQRVVSAGAVLLDAESRLNPSLAAGYFGASGRPSSTVSRPPAATPSDDAARIAKQKICPVTGELLGSMGAPVLVSVAGQSVYVCCKGCEKPLLRKPDEYLPKLTK